MDKRIFAFVTCFILLSSCGIGTVAAESSGDNSTVDDGLTDDSTGATSVDDTASYDTASYDTAADDVSTDDSIEYTYVDNISENDTSAGDSFNENQTEENLTVGESTGDNSTDEDELTDDMGYYNESREPESNIEYIDESQVYINNEQNVYININNKISVVNNINFDSKKAAGKTTVVVEDLKDKSRLIHKRPAGNIYKSFNIWIDKIGINDIENAVINFHVEKSWLKDNKIDKSAIILNMYSNGEWVEIPVILTSEDAKYVYYEAKVSGYSSFVITGQNITASGSEQNIELNNSTGNLTIFGGDESNKNIIVLIIDRILIMFK